MPANTRPIFAALVILAIGLFVVRSYPQAVFRGVPPLSPQALGLFRVFFGGGMLYALLAYGRPEAVDPALVRDYPWWGEWAIVDDLATSQVAVDVIVAVTAVALGMFTIGFLTRRAQIVAVIGLVLVALVRLEVVGSHDWDLPLWAFAATLFVRFGDGFSVDEAIRRLRGGERRPNIPEARYGLGIWLPGLIVGLGLAAAAYAKLTISGIEWATSGAVGYHWIIDSVHAPTALGLKAASAEPIAVAASVGALAIEGLFFLHLAFRSEWIRSAFGLVALTLFAGFYLFQGVLWVPWWVVLLAFLPWQRIWDLMSRSLPQVVVLVDGGCPLCRRTARTIDALDGFDRVRFADAASEAERTLWAPGVSRQRALEEMVVVEPDTGRRELGVGGYLLLARAMPLLWPVAAALRVPPLRRIAERIYRRVGISRHRDCSDESCAAGESLAALPRVRPASRRAAAIGGSVAIFVPFLIAGQALVSRLELEREPLLSNFPMYATTFASRDAFDESRATAAHDLEVVTDAGHEPGGEAITAELDELSDDQAEQIFDDLYERAVRAHNMGQAVTAEDLRAVSELRERWRQRFQRPLTNLTVMGVYRPFLWSEGRFGDVRRAPLYAMEEDRVRLLVGSTE